MKWTVNAELSNVGQSSSVSLGMRYYPVTQTRQMKSESSRNGSHTHRAGDNRYIVPVYIYLPLSNLIGKPHATANGTNRYARNTYALSIFGNKIDLLGRRSAGREGLGADPWFRSKMCVWINHFQDFLVAARVSMIVTLGRPTIYFMHSVTREFRAFIKAPSSSLMTPPHLAVSHQLRLMNRSLNSATSKSAGGFC